LGTGEREDKSEEEKRGRGIERRVVSSLPAAGREKKRRHKKMKRE